MTSIWIGGRELAGWQKALLLVVAVVFGTAIALLFGATLLFAGGIALLLIAGLWVAGRLLRAFAPKPEPFEVPDDGRRFIDRERE